MTVVVAVKVFDGIVLAADSATTLRLTGGGHQVYNNANKVFHLHRRMAIGMATWGLGAIGPASISTLAKDLRRRLTGDDPDHKDWELLPDYTMQEVANRVVEMMFDELYGPLIPPGAEPEKFLGFLLAGYSGSERKSEVWSISLEDSSMRPVPKLEADSDSSGWLVRAQPEAAARLFYGIDPDLLASMKATLDPTEMAKIEALLPDAYREAVPPGMPLADAIGLAQFLVNTTIGYVRYLLGPDTVGGPVEVAGISRHEGFKWVQRKHYYPAELNPEDPHHVF